MKFFASIAASEETNLNTENQTAYFKEAFQM